MYLKRKEEQAIDRWIRRIRKTHVIVEELTYLAMGIGTLVAVIKLIF